MEQAKTKATHGLGKEKRKEKEHIQNKEQTKHPYNKMVHDSIHKKDMDVLSAYPKTNAKQ
jgi:hypothetical protein